MTIPSLMNNYQRQTYVTQLHKVYNETQQALLQYQTDRNGVNLLESGLNSNANVYSFVENYFKIVQKCDTMSSPCFANSYKKMDGSIANSYDPNWQSYVLASGASLRPAYSRTGNRLVNFAVDINGTKGPNVTGRDLFWLYIYNDGSIDDMNTANLTAPLTREEREASFAALCTASTSVDGCFGKILNDNWQMNY